MKTYRAFTTGLEVRLYTPQRLSRGIRKKEKPQHDPIQILIVISRALVCAA